MSFHSPGLNMHRGFNVLFGDVGAPAACKDGPVWTLGNLATSSNWRGGVFGKSGSGAGRFVAAGNNGATPVVNYSDDNGVTWNAAATPPTSAFLNNAAGGSFAYGNGIWLGLNGANIARSVDGSNWTNQSPPSGGQNAIVFGKTNFIIAANGVTQCKTSPSGLGGSWVLRTLPATSPTGAAYLATDGAGLVVYAGNGTGGASTFRSTDDGATWSSGGSLPAPFNGTVGLTALRYGNGVLVGCNSGVTGSVCFSTDGGLTWSLCATTLTSFLPSTCTWSDLIYSQGRWLLFSTTSNVGQGVILQSIDGNTWTLPANHALANPGGATNVYAGVAADGLGHYVVIFGTASATTTMERGSC